MAVSRLVVILAAGFVPLVHAAKCNAPSPNTFYFLLADGVQGAGYSTTGLGLLQTAGDGPVVILQRTFLD